MTQNDVVEGIADLAIAAWLDGIPGWTWHVLCKVLGPDENT